MLDKFMLTTVFVLVFIFNASAELIHANHHNIVMDDIRLLMWQDDEDSKFVSMYFSTAKQYCDEKVLDGYSDWRLPSVNELLYIVDRHRAVPAIFLVFKYGVRDSYWTSILAEQNKVNTVSFEEGNIHISSTNEKKFVRCVRTANKNEIYKMRGIPTKGPFLNPTNF